MLKIGHRGAPHVAPANTLPSFRAAFEAGCDWVECDCRASSDGVVVLAHDPSVVDTRGKRWRIDEHPARELAALDMGSGEGVPNLADLVAMARERGGVMADVKVGGFERQILETLAPLAPQRKIVSGADDAGRRTFRDLDADVPISVTVDAKHEAELVRRWAEIDTNGVTFEHPLVTPERVQDLHRRGIAIYVWTVDDLPTLRRLADMGVDGLISNRADLLAQL